MAREGRQAFVLVFFDLQWRGLGYVGFNVDYIPNVGFYVDFGMYDAITFIMEFFRDIYMIYYILSYLDNHCAL